MQIELFTFSAYPNFGANRIIKIRAWPYCGANQFFEFLSWALLRSKLTLKIFELGLFVVQIGLALLPCASVVNLFLTPILYDQICPQKLIIMNPGQVRV